jgi:hypothetical protein
MDEGKVCHDLVILELWHDEKKYVSMIQEFPWRAIEYD